MPNTDQTNNHINIKSNPNFKFPILSPYDINLLIIIGTYISGVNAINDIIPVAIPVDSTGIPASPKIDQYVDLRTLTIYANTIVIIIHIAVTFDVKSTAAIDIAPAKKTNIIPCPFVLNLSIINPPVNPAKKTIT